LAVEGKLGASVSPVFAPHLGIETTGKVTRYGLAQAAQAMGDQVVAQQRYEELVALWKNADPDRPEVVVANRFLVQHH